MRAGNRPAISEPIFSKVQGEPIVSMAVPVRDADGGIRAVLVGTIRLARDNFLGHLASAKVGKTGYFLVLTAGPKPVSVIHPDPRRILGERGPDATPGTTRALAGFEGTLEDTNGSGLRALFNYRQVPTTGWLLASALPVDEAYAPIARARTRASRSSSPAATAGPASHAATTVPASITETVAVTNFADAKHFIDEVRRAGVRIALDDFGAGASSFGYLKNLPVDFLKIDGQFVIGLLDDAAVRCFREVAKVVGVATVAEFVEREETYDQLATIGIDMAQGYLIHRLEPLHAMTRHDTTRGG